MDMVEGFSRVQFTGEEVIELLDMDGNDGGLDDTLFSGSIAMLWVGLTKLWPKVYEQLCGDKLRLQTCTSTNHVHIHKKTMSTWHKHLSHKSGQSFTVKSVMQQKSGEACNMSSDTLLREYLYLNRPLKTNLHTSTSQPIGLFKSDVIYVQNQQTVNKQKALDNKQR